MLLAKVPNSSFAEAHKGFISELTHIEDEVKDQEDEVEDGRDCEECKGRESKRGQTHKRMKHGWYDAHKHLSQCRVRQHYKCGQHQENVCVRVFCSQSESLVRRVGASLNSVPGSSGRHAGCEVSSFDFSESSECASLKFC